jgi:hypothetical protein
MSTTFGIHRRNEIIELIDDDLPIDFNPDDFIEIAYRVNKYTVFTNELASYLSDDLKVYPLDNTAQGVYTVGDIKKLNR